MKRIVLSLLLILVATLPAAAQVHVPTPDGWTGFDEEYRYGRETLWEYINGAAELFLNYQFQELVAADFERGEAFLTVSIYDMGFPIDAYGIFEAEKPASAVVLDEPGAAAVLRAPYQGLMIKDRYYVKVEIGGGNVDDTDLAAVLVDVAGSLHGEDGLPPELEALPVEGRLPGTVAFAGSNYLGFEDLAGCLYADYEGGDDDGYRLFVMKPSGAFLRNEKGKWSQSESEGRMVFSREIPYRGVVVLMGDEASLLGVSGIADMVTASNILISILK